MLKQQWLLSMLLFWLIIWASLSETHTSVTALHTCVCMFACLLCLLVCLDRPLIPDKSVYAMSLTVVHGQCSCSLSSSPPAKWIAALSACVVTYICTHWPFSYQICLTIWSLRLVPGWCSISLVANVSVRLLHMAAACGTVSLHFQKANIQHMMHNLWHTISYLPDVIHRLSVPRPSLFWQLLCIYLQWRKTKQMEPEYKWKRAGNK